MNGRDKLLSFGENSAEHHLLRFGLGSISESKGMISRASQDHHIIVQTPTNSLALLRLFLHSVTSMHATPLFDRSLSQQRCGNVQKSLGTRTSRIWLIILFSGAFLKPSINMNKLTIGYFQKKCKIIDQVNQLVRLR